MCHGVEVGTIVTFPVLLAVAMRGDDCLFAGYASTFFHSLIAAI